MKTKFILLLTAFFLFSSLNGQRKILNEDYTLVKENPKLALLPVNYQNPVMIDTLMADIFYRNADRVEIIPPETCRQLIDADTMLNSIFLKIVNKKYRYRHLKKFPNLSEILSDEEINYLSQQLFQADLLLIPLSFDIDTRGIRGPGAYTIGSSRFRLYDLETGDFIFDFSHSLEFFRGGDKGERGMAISLLVVTQKLFEDQLINTGKPEQ